MSNREEEALRTLAYYHANGDRYVQLSFVRRVVVSLTHSSTQSAFQHGPPRRVRVRRDPGRNQVRQGGRGERRLAEPHPVPGQQETSADHGRDRVLLAVVGQQPHVSTSHVHLMIRQAQLTD